MSRVFYLLIHGEGGGCDYTIACNKDFRRLKATTSMAAVAEAAEYVKEHGFSEIEDMASEEIWTALRECRLQSLQILSVDHEEKFDISGWVQPFLVAAKEREKAESEASERAELDRLQKKYGGAK